MRDTDWTIDTSGDAACSLLATIDDFPSESIASCPEDTLRILRLVAQRLVARLDIELAQREANG